MNVRICLWMVKDGPALTADITMGTVKAAAHAWY